MWAASVCVSYVHARALVGLFKPFWAMASAIGAYGEGLVRPRRESIFGRCFDFEKLVDIKEYFFDVSEYLFKDFL